MGEKLEEIPPHLEMAETSQVPTKDEARLCGFPGSLLARPQPRQLENDFNFPHATLAIYCSATQLQRMLHSIKHTLRLAVKTSGRPVKGPELQPLRVK